MSLYFFFRLVFNDKVISLLDAHSRERKTYVHTKTCMQMFIAALLITVLSFKQTKWPPAGEWTNCGPSILWNTTQQ